jgi:hypothetical protein
MGAECRRSNSGLTPYCFSFLSRFDDRCPVLDTQLMCEMPRNTTMVRAVPPGARVLAMAVVPSRHSAGRS